MSSFTAGLGRIDRRARATRMSFYRALLDGNVRMTDAGTPDLLDLYSEARHPDSTFRKHFAVDGYPTLQPCAGRTVGGLERLVLETKTWTLDPMVRGYRESSARLHSPASARLAALTRVLVTWALRFRLLAALHAEQLPDSVERAILELSGPDPRNESTRVEIRALILDAVAATRESSVDAQSDEVMSSLRGRIAQTLPVDADLLRASRELASHVGAFMLLSNGSEGEVDPELRFILERAIRSLRAVDVVEVQP